MNVRFSYLFLVCVTVPLFCKHELPKQFGKKQFIVGASSDSVRQDTRAVALKNRLQLDGKASIRAAFFTPDYTVRSILLDLIVCEQEKISIAAFLLTDDGIAQALIDAQKRGIKVEVVTDRFCCKNRHGKIALLNDAAVQLFVYHGGQKPGAHLSDIMHNKFIIFEKNILDRSLLWTGSYNFTHSAWRNNHENVVLLDDRVLIGEYKKQFELLKEKSVAFSGVKPSTGVYKKRAKKTKRKENIGKVLGVPA